jgi:electron transfer flavoprotein beta subunit
MEVSHMNILVLLKHVPDLVEELEVAGDGQDLDRSWIRYIPSEYDEHALEQAILLKEEHGGSVTAAALDIGDIDDVLFTAVAKGADSVIRLANAREGMSAAAAAAEYATLYRTGSYDLVLTGVHAIDDLDGPVGARLAAILDLPYVGVVSGMVVDTSAAVAHVHKEYPGGLLTVIRTQLPAVIGIQSAMKPPRYVPIARIRQASKSAVIDEVAGNGDVVSASAVQIRELRKPDSGSQARMLEGGTEEIVDQLLKLFLEQGIVR